MGALVAGDHIADLGRKLPQYLTLADFLGSPDFVRRERILKSCEPDLDRSPVTYLPVIPRREKIVCATRNYLDHHQEAVPHSLRREITAYLPIFLRVWRSQVGHNAPVIRSKASTQLNWEGELAVIIGKGGPRTKPWVTWRDTRSITTPASVIGSLTRSKSLPRRILVGTGAFGPWSNPENAAPLRRSRLIHLCIGSK